MTEEYQEYLKKKEINTIINGVLSKFPLLGVTVSKLGFEPRDLCKTAATDGQKVYWSEAFMERLSFDQKVFVFAHEIMHVAFKHIERRTSDKNNKIWNIATDAVINARLLAEGLPKVDGLVDIPEAIDKSAEEMYQMLENQTQDQAPNGQGGGSGEENESDQGNSSSSNVGHDDHDIWDEVIKRLEESAGESSQDDDTSENSEDGNGNAGEESDEDVDDFEKNFSDKNKTLKEEKAKEIISKLRQRTNKDLSDPDVKLGQIGIAKAVVKWKTILRREIDNEEFRYTYRRSDEDNDFQARGEMIDVYDHPMTECLLDTSGSVSANTIRNFLRQLKPLLRESKLKVACFDDDFYGFTEIKRDQDIETFRIQGRGGTDFDLALSSFSSDSDGVINKIIFTDGYDIVSDTEFNRKLKNVIWLVYGNKSFNPCVGKVIFIDEKSLRYLAGSSLEELSQE